MTMQRCRWKPYAVGNQSFKACLAQQGKKVAQVYQALSGSTTTGAAPQAAWGHVPEHWGCPRGQRPPAGTRRAVSLGQCPMLHLVLVPPVLSLCLWEQGLAPESLGPLWDPVLLVISFNTPLFHAKCAIPSAGCQVLCLWHPSYQHIFVAVLGCSKVRAQGWGNEVRGSPKATTWLLHLEITSENLTAVRGTGGFFSQFFSLLVSQMMVQGKARDFPLNLSKNITLGSQKRVSPGLN